jgi:pyroglutamyl-peptidase
MTATILLTGFGPFPGAPFNPTGPLVTELARRRTPALRNIRRVAHVFATSYESVDRELPALLARERPAALVLFGLASRRRHIRIETRARNALTGAVPDASGWLPAASMIIPGARTALSLRAPAQRLVAAVRAAGMSATLSVDAGNYLCNYLCWRAGEAAERDGVPRLVAFVHVPNVPATNAHVPTARRLYRPRSRLPVTFNDLIHAGEAIMLAALDRSQAVRCRWVRDDCFDLMCAPASPPLRRHSYQRHITLHTG